MEDKKIKQNPDAYKKDPIDRTDTDNLNKKADVPSKREVVEYKKDTTDVEKNHKNPSQIGTAIDNIAKSISPDKLLTSNKDIAKLKTGMTNNLAESIKSSTTKLNTISNELLKHTKADKSKDSVDIARNKKTQFDVEAKKIDTTILLKHFEVSNKINATLLRSEMFNKTITSVFYRKSLEYQYSHLEVAKKILTATKSGFNKLELAIAHDVKNSGLPDYLKMKDLEIIKSKAKGRLADSILDKSGEVINSYREKLTAGKDDDDVKPAKGKSPSKVNTILTTLLVAQLSKTPLGKKIVDYTKGAMDDPSTALKGVAKKVGKEYDNIYVNATAGKISRGLTGLAGMLNSDAGIEEITSLDSKKLGAPAALDKRSAITKNEVITGYLAKMLKELTLIRTGKQESEVETVKFNYETRSFSTEKDMTNTIVSKMNKSIKKSRIGKDIIGIAKYILNNANIPYGNDILVNVKTGLTSYMISNDSLNIGKLPPGFYTNFNPEAGMILQVGVNNILDSENRTDSINMIRDAFSTARSKMPDMTKMVNKQVNLGNTELLAKAGIINLDTMTQKYSINKDMYNKKMMSEVSLIEDVDELDLEKDKANRATILDKVKKKTSEVKSDVDNSIKSKMPDMTKMVNKQDSILNFITNMKDEAISTMTDKSSKTIEVLRTTITSIFDKLDISQYIISPLTNSELLHSFTLLETIGSSNDLKGKLLIYLHSISKVSDDALESIMKDLRMSKKENPTQADDILATIDSNKDVRAINNLNKQRAENSKKEIDIEDVEERIEAREDKRIESIVTKIIKKVGVSKTPVTNDTDNDGVRDGSWMSRVLGKGKVESTAIGKNAGVITPKKKDESSSPIWKILGLLGMGIPILIKYITGVADSVGWIWNIIKGAGSFLTSLGGSIINGVGMAIGGMKDILVGGFNLAASAVGGLKDILVKGFDIVANTVSKAFNGVKSMIGLGDDVVDEAIDVADELDPDKDKDKDKKKSEDDKDKDKTKDKSEDDDKDKKDKKGKRGRGRIKPNTKGSNKAVTKVVSKSLSKKVFGLGIVAGTAYGINELTEGNLLYAAGEFTSGLVGSIPFIGTAASFGIDAGMELYKARNPKIDKELYDGKTYPNMDADTADQLTLNHIRQYETGTAAGKYDLAEDIGDGAGISFGTYQFTEKSGNLKEYIKRVVALTNDPTGQAILDNFDGNDYTGNQTGLIRYLKATGATNAGKYVQDTMYKELFMDPAKQLAASYGITDKAAISQIIDHSVNAGLGGAKRMLQRAAGDYSPDNIARARKLDYNSLIDGNAKLAKYRDNWFGRVDGNAKLFSSFAGEVTMDPNRVPNNNALNALGISEEPNNVMNSINQQAARLNNSTTNPNNIVGAQQTTLNGSNMTTFQQPMGFSQANIAPSINMDSVEKILATSNKHLETIAGNTTRMVTNNATTYATLLEIKKLLSTPQKEKAPVNEAPTPMSKGVSVKG